MMAKGSKFGDLPLPALLNAEPAPEAESVEAQPASFEETVEQADSAQAKMAFLLGLRARGIADVNILRALATIPRVTFAPHRYRDLALREVALPIACGQTMSEPWLTARMIEALLVSPEHRVLEIGSGSGYATAILARLASQVVSVERFKSLVVEAQTRLDLLGLTNVDVVWGDGLALPPEQGPFDRILIHGLLDGLPEAIFGLLADGGIIVAGRAGEAGVRVVKLAHGPTGVTGEDVCPARLRPLIPGVARSL